MVVNTLSSQFAEISADLLGGVLYFKLGPRLSMCLVFCISIIGAIGLIFTFDSGNQTYIAIFVGVAKFGISAAFNMIFICFM